MPLPTFNPPIGPSPGTTHKYDIKLREAEFGDGYAKLPLLDLELIRK